MAMVEDITAFFNVDEFAVQAQLAGATVTGIFDAAYTDAFSAIAMTGPQFRLPTADVQAAGASVGSAFTLGGIDYRVMSIRPDGTGVSLLALEVD